MQDLLKFTKFSLLGTFGFKSIPYEFHIADLDKSGNDASTVLSVINAGTFPRDRAHVRAKVLYDSDPTKYKIIIGSLGFVQDNGRVYWNLG